MEKNMSEFEQVAASLRNCAKLDNDCGACPFKEERLCMDKLMERAADGLLNLEKERVLADANYASLHKRFETRVKENYVLTKMVDGLMKQNKKLHDDNVRLCKENSFHQAIMKVCTTDKKQEEPMEMKELSANEIIESLKCCANTTSCKNCSYCGVNGCHKKLMLSAAEKLERYAYGFTKECRCCDGVAPDHGHDHDVLQMDLCDAIRTIADMGWDLIVNLKISSETLLELLGDIFDDRA